MRSLITFIILYILINNLQAQDCPEKYQKLLEKGEELLNNKKYADAIFKFLAAQIAARECGLANDNQPAEEIKKALKGLEKQKNDALDAQREAERQKDIAKTEKDKADEALLEAEKSRVQADTARAEAERERIKTKAALDQAEKLIDAFYFYDDNIALASQEIIGEGIKFGYINKEGNVVVDFKYDKAQLFEYPGFARVYRDSTNYIIDTEGNEYKAAFNFNEQKEEITALDLRQTELIQLPTKIRQFKALQILLLTNNKLTQLPAEIGQLKSLQNLYLIAVIIEQLYSLQSLDLGINYFKELQMNHATSFFAKLNLSDNFLDNFPSKIGQISLYKICI